MNIALVVIDIQNDITKNYEEIIHNINSAIDWAVDNNIYEQKDNGCKIALLFFD